MSIHTRVYRKGHGPACAGVVENIYPLSRVALVRWDNGSVTHTKIISLIEVAA